MDLYKEIFLTEVQYFFYHFKEQVQNNGHGFFFVIPHFYPHYLYTYSSIFTNFSSKYDLGICSCTLRKNPSTSILLYFFQ